MKELQRSRRKLVLVSVICSFLSIALWFGGLYFFGTTKNAVIVLMVAFVVALAALFSGIKISKINKTIFKVMEFREEHLFNSKKRVDIDDEFEYYWLNLKTR